MVDQPLLRQLLDAMPSMVLVLDPESRVAYANVTAPTLLGLDDQWPILGRRFGGVLGFVHALETPGGRDTTEFCKTCIAGMGVGEMVKNALEASQPGEMVMLGYQMVGNEIEFWVHSAAPMSREVQLQVFQRAFSTQGRGRGLGTYGMMLLSQRCLKGDVTFTSSKEEGTTFRASYPLRPPVEGQAIGSEERV